VAARDAYRRRFNELRWDNGYQVLAATEGREFRAVANVQMGHPSYQEVAYVSGIVTLPEHRNRGIGSVLLWHIAEVAGQFGYDTVGLAPANERNKLLYQRLGFSPISAKSAVWSVNAAALRDFLTK